MIFFVSRKTVGISPPFLLGSGVMLKQVAFSKIIWAMAGYHAPEVRSVMPYLDVAEFVNNDIVKAGKWHPDQVEIEGNTFGFVGITSPTRFHSANSDGRQRKLFCLHQVMAFN